MAGRFAAAAFGLLATAPAAPYHPHFDLDRRCLATHQPPAVALET